MTSDRLCTPLRGIFIDDENNLYSLCRPGQNLSVWWQQNKTNPSKIRLDNVTLYTTLFASAHFGHQVEMALLDAMNRSVNIRAGFTSWQLNGLWGIFVGINLNLYVAVGLWWKYRRQTVLCLLCRPIFFGDCRSVDQRFAHRLFHE